MRLGGAYCGFICLDAIPSHHMVTETKERSEQTIGISVCTLILTHLCMLLQAVRHMIQQHHINSSRRAGTSGWTWNSSCD